MIGSCCTKEGYKVYIKVRGFKIPFIVHECISKEGKYYFKWLWMKIRLLGDEGSSYRFNFLNRREYILYNNTGGGFRGKYYYYLNLPESEYKEELKKWYKNKTGENLNIEDPKTFNEKLQWMKLYDSTPLKTKLADKYEVREWIKEKIGEEYLVPLLGVYNSFEEIIFEKLPNRFVIKCTHGSGMNIIILDKSKLDKLDIKKKLNEWMGLNFAFNNGFELHYKTMKPRIIVEEYLENNVGGLDDYKVWCFGKEVNCIQVYKNRYSDSSIRVGFFTEKWKFIEGMSNNNQLQLNADDEVFKENKIIDLSKILSENFSFVRVDWYILNDGSVKFGEITFTPASGIMYWKPPSKNLELGKLIKMIE